MVVNGFDYRFLKVRFFRLLQLICIQLYLNVSAINLCRGFRKSFYDRTTLFVKITDVWNVQLLARNQNLWLTSEVPSQLSAHQ